MKILQICEFCKKRRLVVKKRKITLPIGLVALSQKQMCRNCQRSVQNAVKTNG